MDHGIIDLVQAMNDVLSFVEEADTLHNKLTSLTETIQKILVVIQECSTSIYEYLNSSIAGTLSCPIKPQGGMYILKRFQVKHGKPSLKGSN